MKIKANASYKKSEARGFSVVLLFKNELDKWENELKNQPFEADFKEAFYFNTEKSQYLFVGLGDKNEFTIEKFASITAIWAKKCEKLKKTSINLFIPITPFSDVDLGKTLIESINLSLYRFVKYKTNKIEFSISELNIFLDGTTSSRIKSLSQGFELGNLFSIAVNYTRDLVNEPGSVTTPSFLAAEALKIEKSCNHIETAIYDAKKMHKIGMDAALAIGRGSMEEPKFIKIEYKPRGAFDKIVLVGKGLTFDSGGLSLKTSQSMETMKIDMAGAAAVLGIFKIIEKLGIKVHVVGLIAAVENMPSGSSVRPGDIVRAMNGKTIEILNTDAEGRVTLADSLSFANSLKPKIIIDLATLTGACVVALGEEITGVMGNKQELVNEILGAGTREGEKFWQLPLEDKYKEMLKSTVADIKNTAKKYGGAITAGLFLQEFVGLTPWVHLDIAGPAYYEKDSDLIPKGASGIPVKTLLRWLMLK